MCNYSSIVNDTIKVFSSDLIVGDHDSITLFGIHVQNSLKDYSHRVTALLLRETEDLDMAMSEVLCEIERFEGKINRPIQSVFGKQRHQRDLIKEYSKILTYIDNMTLYFKLQQTQLIKEIKLLDRLAEAVVSNSQELEHCIETGKSILKNRKTNQVQTRNLSSLENTETEDEIWYERLTKRIDDLSISHAVSLQSQAQIRVLRDNDLLFLDRIASAISNTLPIWQNQMALMLGIDLLEARLNVQDKVLDVSEKHIKQSVRKIKNGQRKSKSCDINHILQLNQSLKKALDEMTQLEATDDELRKEFLTTVYRGEGG